MKIQKKLPKDINKGFNIKFKGDDEKICIQDMKRADFSLEGVGEKVKNHKVEVNSKPYMVLNNHPLNNIKMLWLRDSFGSSNSAFFQKTFHRIWEIHHGHLFGNKLKEFVIKHHPNIILFQVVERGINGTHFQKPFT